MQSKPPPVKLPSTDIISANVSKIISLAADQKLAALIDQETEQSIHTLLLALPEAAFVGDIDLDREIYIYL